MRNAILNREKEIETLKNAKGKHYLKIERLEKRIKELELLKETEQIEVKKQDSEKNWNDFVKHIKKAYESLEKIGGNK